MKKNLLFLAMLFMLCAVSNAAFLQYNFSPRAAGMGGAFTAISDDVSSLVSNPAGLSHTKNISLLFVYDKPFAGISDIALTKNSFLFGLSKFSIGAFGLSYTGFGTELYNEMSIGLTYSKNFRDFFLDNSLTSLGLSVKYLSTAFTLDDRTSNDPVFTKGKGKTGISFDLGALLEPSRDNLPGLTFGVTAKNLNSPDLGIYSKDIVPMELRGGIGYKLGQIRTAAEGSMRNNEIGYNLGAEADIINDMFIVRLGLNKEEAAAGFSFNLNGSGPGMGLSLDYAFGFPLYVQESIGSHRVGLGIKF